MRRPVSMAAFQVERPVVRSFQYRFRSRAAAYVRSGGHAVVWETPNRALLVIPKPDKTNPKDLGLWSLLDLGKQRCRIPKEGTFRGLGVALVPRDLHDAVRWRAERDAELPGPIHKMTLDCLACAACCVDNEVVLSKGDLDRFHKGGRADLSRRPFTRRSDGRVLLVLARDKRCKQLGPDNSCGIYPLRPDACRDFPAGSECCIFSRMDAFGTWDKEPPTPGKN